MKHSLLDEREQIETALDSAVGLAQAAILLLEGYSGEKMTPRVQDSIAEILESMVLRLDTAMAGLQHHWDMPGCDLPFSDRPSQH